MPTICKDKKGTTLLVDSRPDFSRLNPGGTICGVYISTVSGWAFSRKVTLSRHQYNDMTPEKSITEFMSRQTFK